MTCDFLCKMSLKHRLAEGKYGGGAQSKGVSQSVRATGRDESQGVPPQKTLQNKGFAAPIFRGICPKLLAALLGIQLYLPTPVLPRGQIAAIGLGDLDRGLKTSVFPVFFGP